MRAQPQSGTAIAALAIAVLALITALAIGAPALANSISSQSSLLQRVVTDNGTLSPLLNNELRLHGISGLRSSLLPADLITYDNLRDLTPYTVDAAGGSEYLTPQEAYMAALADGRGGTGTGAVIMIAPGAYDFGNALFEINTTGIVFASLAGPGNGVVFTASGLAGGLLINVPQSLTATAIFNGITFGAVGDANGFLIRLQRGALGLYQCTAQDTNIRIVAGGAPMGEFVVFSTTACHFSPLPPADFFTSLDGQVQLFIEQSHWVQLGFGGSPVSPGGAIFNLSMGVGEMRVLQSFFVIAHYDAVVAGPLPDVSGGERVIIFNGCSITTLDANPMSTMLVMSGPVGLQMINCATQMQNSLVYQRQNCNSADPHFLYVVGGGTFSRNATVRYEANLTQIGSAEFNFANSLVQNGASLILDISGATAPDFVTVRIAGSTLASGGPPGSDYALGPGAALATLNVGSSVSINGANGQTGFTYTPMTTL